jgi:hypothetical protein
VSRNGSNPHAKLRKALGHYTTECPDLVAMLRGSRIFHPADSSQGSLSTLPGKPADEDWLVDDQDCMRQHATLFELLTICSLIFSIKPYY